MTRSRKITAGTPHAARNTHNVDTRLVAAVQTAAGARCHEAANLLQAYYNSAEAYRRLSSDARGDNAATAAEEARQLLHAAKIRLRDFLAECLLGWIDDPASKHQLNSDRPQPRAKRRALHVYHN